MAQLKAGSTVGGNTIATDAPAVVPINSLAINGTKEFGKIVVVKDGSLTYIPSTSEFQSGFSSGGARPPSATLTNTIDKFPFSTVAQTSVISTNVGSLSSNTSGSEGYSSTTEAFALKYPGANIDKFPFTASFTTATSVGTLSSPRSALSHSSSTDGFASGPLTIDKFPFTAPFTTATNIGSLSKTVDYVAVSHSSSTEGFFQGVVALADTYEFEKFPFAAPSVTATSLSSTPIGPVGWINEQAPISSPLHGYIVGGYGPASFIDSSNSISRFPFSAPHIPSVFIGTYGFIDDAAGHNSTSEGFITGGSNRGIGSAGVGRFPFSSVQTTAITVGSLTQARWGLGGHQY